MNDRIRECNKEEIEFMRQELKATKEAYYLEDIDTPEKQLTDVEVWESLIPPFED